MMWFEELTGFCERSPEHVRENLRLDGEILKSHVNGNTMICGHLETPSLAELRERVRSINNDRGRLSVREVVANVQNLHADESLAGSLFQVASQFNLLEMVSPSTTPEHGVGIYERDPTQGPACAIAAGAGTIYRNYFAAVDGQAGQTANNQIDCLSDLGKAFGNSRGELWRMQNGYAIATQVGLSGISERLSGSSEAERDELRQLLRIGIQSNTQVTLKSCRHLVSQAYCSALPISYCPHPTKLWEGFARLVLEASYESTICAAILNSRNTRSKKVFLTFVGGGAFGNPATWIVDAMQRALELYRIFELDVAIVSYGHSSEKAQQIVHSFSR
jgi:hypothetical protein